MFQSIIKVKYYFANCNKFFCLCDAMQS